jgi:hypothetical protein
MVPAGHAEGPVPQEVTPQEYEPFGEERRTSLLFVGACFSRSQA